MKSRSFQNLAGASTLALLFALGGNFCAAANAQDDPPARVGRIATLQGTVSIRPSADAEWTSASQNYPVAAGNAIWADDGARVEVEIGGAEVWLNAGTELDIVQLDNQNVVLSVPQGRADVSLRNRDPGELYDVQTPRGAVDLLDNGTYRIVAGSQQEPSKVAAFGGRAQFQGANELMIGSGEEVVASTDTPTNYSVGTASQDGFDQWALQQDQAIYARPVPSYVPQEPGVADLEQYGAWQDTEQYGHVWIPADVGPDWAPYRHGHWAYVQPWGYTWVDDAPWGFAPFHYGRWVQTPGGWGWVPRDRDAEITIGYRPVYAPALVSFVGDPGALTVGVNIGGVGISVGWFPLGPGEAFRPWYHHGEDYDRDVNRYSVNRTVINNIHNTTIINNNVTYINQRAVTVVPRQAFAGGQPIARAAYHVPPQALSRPMQVAAPTAVAETFLPRPERSDRGARPANAPPPAQLRVAPSAEAAAAFRARNVSAPDARPAAEIAQPQQPRQERPAEARIIQPQRPAPQVEEPRAAVRPIAQPQRPVPQLDRPAPQQQRPAEVSRPVEHVRPQEERAQAQASRPVPQIERAVPQQERVVQQPRQVERPPEQHDRPAAQQPHPAPQAQQQPEHQRRNDQNKDDKKPN